jgi:hypothetical protein
VKRKFIDQVLSRGRKLSLVFIDKDIVECMDKELNKEVQDKLDIK